LVQKKSFFFFLLSFNQNRRAFNMTTTKYRETKR
jgi:hypothetical protein